MLFRTLAINPVPKIVADNTTMKGRDISTRDYTHWVVTVASKTITLPTPIKDLSGKFVAIVNASDGDHTVSGAFAGGGTSISMASKDTILLCCLPTATATYKWTAVGLSTGPGTEATQDIVGAMFTGNTETGVVCSYQDADGTIDVEIVDEYIADLCGSMWSGNTLTGLTVTYQDADNTIDAAVTYGTTSGTACQGNDARLLATAEKTALGDSLNWQDWVPAPASCPATSSVVGRYRKIGKGVEFIIDIRGSDGDGWTPSTIALPVAPVDLNALIPLNAIQMQNTSTYTNPLAFVDAETSTYPIKFRAASACTDGAPWSLQISGFYEVASI